MRFDYVARRIKMRDALNVEDEEAAICKMYVQESMCAQEIVDRLKAMGVNISVRSIQRITTKHACNRAIGDAFRLAAKKGRVKWAYKDPLLKARRGRLKKGMRYRILKRDGFTCKLCGATAEDDLLEVDHILAIVNGGTDDETNLRILCHTCNVGKKIEEREV